MNYVEKNQEILNRWKAQFCADKSQESEYKDCNPADNFAEDGIMNKGDFYLDEDICKRHPCGKENELWTKAPLRVLFLSKEPSNIAWDVRTETFYQKGEGLPPQNNEISESQFYQNEAVALYGLFHTNIESGIPDYYGITWEQALKFSDEQIFARINCKKEPGSHTSVISNLNQEINKYWMFLSEQIQNIDADVIICSGKSYLIHKLNAIYKSSFEQFPSIPCAWYNKKENKLAIDSYHLAYNRRKGADLIVYHSILDPYYEFIKQYPYFLKEIKSKRTNR